MPITLDRDIRRVQNAKESSVASGDMKSAISHSPAVRAMRDGEQVFAQESNKQLTLYKKSKGALWKVALSMNGNQFVDKDLEVKGSATIRNDLTVNKDLTVDEDLIIEGTVVSKGLFTVYATSDSSDWIAKFLDSGGSTVAGFYQDSDEDGALFIYDSSDTLDVLLVAQDGSFIRNKVTIGSQPSSPYPYGNSDLTLDGTGALMLKETTTPTQNLGYAKIYTKSNNKLYFQDGECNDYTVDTSSV